MGWPEVALRIYKDNRDVARHAISVIITVLCISIWGWVNHSHTTDLAQTIVGTQQQVSGRLDTISKEEKK